MHPSGSPHSFPTTHWSRVARAGDAEALAKLCAAYWYPIYALIRRKGASPDRAMDLTQAYFARLIEKRTFLAADPARGQLRSFLRTDCTYFLADTHDREQALKRGGGARLVSIDAADAEDRLCREPAHLDTPERQYERDWAVSLIQRALKRVEDHARSRGREAIYQGLRPILTGSPGPARLAEIAAALQMTETALKTALHRLRAQFADELRGEIAETLDDPTPEAIAEELRGLFASLGPTGPKNPR